MDVTLLFAVFIFSLVALLWSADVFIDGSAELSQRLGIPPFIIGMLVVGLGTSAPEMIVALLAALNGSPSLALGNAYGSNIANLGLVLGMMALLAPMAISAQAMRRELPLLVAVTLLTGLALADAYLSRWESITMLVLLLGFIVASLLWQSGGEGLAAGDSSVERPEPLGRLNLFKRVALGVIALGVLIASSRGVVYSAGEMALYLGVSEMVIGLTVVALGTSLPELAASISALRRKDHDMVIGNIIGSNLFNTLGVVGVAGVVAPIATEAEVLMRDWALMTAMTAVFLLCAVSWKHRPRRQVGRFAGGVLLAAYVAYALVLGITALS